MTTLDQPLPGAAPAPLEAGTTPSTRTRGPHAADAVEPGRTQRLMRTARAVIGVAMLLELAVVLVHSWVQWRSGVVAMDFAIFHQAWHQIASGDLSPDSTIVGYPYWRSHLELVMWPLALLGLVFPSGFTLLVVQDLAIVGAQTVALLWVLEVVRRGRTLRPVHLLPVAVALVLMAADNHIRTVATDDFHFQSLATLLVVGGARSLWAGRTKRAWLWLLLSLLTGDVAGTYLAGLGLSALVARRDTRWHGVGLLAVGGGWVALVGALGANRGSAIGGYQHLVDHPLPASGGALVLVVLAILVHPSRPLATLLAKAPLIGREIGGAGLLGLVHPWTFGVMLVVLLSGALQQSLSFFAPFQNFPAIVFGITGTAMALDWLGRRAQQRAEPGGRPRRLALRALPVAGLAITVIASTVAHPRPIPPTAAPVEGAAALQAVDRALRPDDQVVASFGIVGRFAGRADARWFITATQVPVHPGRVVFVFSPTIGNVPAPGVQLEAAAAVRALGATPLVQTTDVQAYAWTPPRGTSQVSLP